MADESTDSTENDPREQREDDLDAGMPTGRKRIVDEITDVMRTLHVDDPEVEREVDSETE